MRQDEKGVPATPDDSDFPDAMQAFAEVRRQYRSTLEKLAGSQNDAGSADAGSAKA